MSNNDNDNKLRIIGGNWRRRKISFPEGNDIRPTPDRVRETLFNWLQFDISGTRCLELYAGSGILSLEAFSRGASHITLVEQSRIICSYLTQTMGQLGVRNDQHSIDCTRARDFLKSPALIRYDILFLDPPFGSDELEIVEPLIPGVLHDNSFVYVENSSRPGHTFAGLTRHREGKAGKVFFALYR